jgi:hypothetical protein
VKCEPVGCVEETKNKNKNKDKVNDSDNSKNKDRPFKTRKEIRLEKFLIDEMDRYIRLHKEHEKEIKYIG